MLDTLLGPLHTYIYTYLHTLAHLILLTKETKVERVYNNLPKVIQLTVVKARICPCVCLRKPVNLILYLN